MCFLLTPIVITVLFGAGHFIHKVSSYELALSPGVYMFVLITISWTNSPTSLNFSLSNIMVHSDSPSGSSATHDLPAPECTLAQSAASLGGSPFPPLLGPAVLQSCFSVI